MYRSAQVKLALLVLAALGVSANGLCGELGFHTSPSQPIAGQPWSIAVEVQTLGPVDLDLSTLPTATVFENRVVINANIECVSVSCDVFQSNYIRVDVPPVPAGTYVIEVVALVNRTLEVVVENGNAIAQVRPVEGFWLDQSRPGNGLVMSLRGETLGVGLFDSAPGPNRFEPIWELDSPTLRGNDALATLRRTFVPLNAPSCLTCPPASTPVLRLSSKVARITFESERRARLTFIGGPTLALVALPFGADYVDRALSDTLDEEFGALPLPNLEGEWVINQNGAPIVATFGPPELAEDSVTFEGGSVRLQCSSASTTRPAGCFFPNETGQLRDTFAALGDTSEARILFRSTGEAGAPLQSFYALRLR